MSTERSENILREGEKAANFRPPLPSGDPSLNDLAAIIERKDREISNLQQELETERRANGKLRAQLERPGQ